MTYSLEMMENHWLADSDQLYLTSNEVTIADLSAACELAQLIPLEGHRIREFPKINAWLSRVLEIPEVKELHSVVLPTLKKVFGDSFHYQAKL